MLADLGPPGRVWNLTPSVRFPPEPDTAQWNHAGLAFGKRVAVHHHDTTTEEKKMRNRADYEVIDLASIPAAVRFDVPGRYQGQIVEYAFGGFGRYEHDDDAPFMRVTDRSLAPHQICYYKRKSK
jgi:hypothetical protein